MSARLSGESQEMRDMLTLAIELLTSVRFWIAGWLSTRFITTLSAGDVSSQSSAPTLTLQALCVWLIREQVIGRTSRSRCPKSTTENVSTDRSPNDDASFTYHFLASSDFTCFDELIDEDAGETVSKMFLVVLETVVKTQLEQVRLPFLYI